MTPSPESLSKLVRSKARWILDKQRRINEIREPIPKKEFVTGESFVYLGRHLRLKVLNSKSSNKRKVFVKQGRFVVRLDGNFDGIDKSIAIRDALIHWYKRHARTTLLKRIRIYSKKLGISPPEMLLGDQVKRWGSCSKKGQIRLNWHIIMAPMSLVDYVVAHELCHLKYIDHSENFWKLLGSVMPDYEARRERLRKEGPKYYF